MVSGNPVVLLSMINTYSIISEKRISLFVIKDRIVISMINNRNRVRFIFVKRG